MDLVEKGCIADAQAIERILRRMAHEIVEHNHGADSLTLIGIETGGVELARRLAAHIERIESAAGVQTGSIDVTLYRDDLSRGNPTPHMKTTNITEPIDDRDVVLVDDVLMTGRSVRAAMAALMDWGRPRTIQLAVLVDRGHRELPIKADYIGLKLGTERRDDVRVCLAGQHEAQADEVRLSVAVEGKR